MCEKGNIDEAVTKYGHERGERAWPSSSIRGDLDTHLEAFPLFILGHTHTHTHTHTTAMG